MQRTANNRNNISQNEPILVSRLSRFLVVTLRDDLQQVPLPFASSTHQNTTEIQSKLTGVLWWFRRSQQYHSFLARLLAQLLCRWAARRCLVWRRSLKFCIHENAFLFDRACTESWPVKLKRNHANVIDSDITTHRCRRHVGEETGIETVETTVRIRECSCRESNLKQRT